MSNILVIGERCVDETIIGHCSRLCPEAPVPVLIPETTLTNEGMSGNVANNIMSLRNEISHTTRICQKTPIKKVRYVDKTSGYIMLRVDFDDKIIFGDQFNILEVCRNVDLTLFNAIIISDYCKGFICENDICVIAEKCNALKIPLFVDTKKILGDWSRLINFVKINEMEYAANLKRNGHPSSFCKNLIVTFGKDGSRLYQQGMEIYHSKSVPVEVKSVCGAGDTYHAALVVAYLEGKGITESMDFANQASAIAVSRQGVVSVCRNELHMGLKL